MTVGKFRVTKNNQNSFHPEVIILTELVAEQLCQHGDTRHYGEKGGCNAQPQAQQSKGPQCKIHTA